MTTSTSSAGSSTGAGAPKSRRGFFGLLAAEAVSLTGSRMSMLALPWFVLVTTGSPLKTGVATFAEMLPYVLASVVAAPLTDRVGARRVSLICDAASALVVGAIPLMHASGNLTFGVLLALIAMAGALRGPGDNAKYVLLPLTTERAGMSMDRSAGIFDGVNRAASLLGAPLAGVLISVLGASAVLTVDAITFGLAFVIIALTAPRRANTTAADTYDDEPGTYRNQLAVGVKFLLGNRLLLAIAVMLFFTNLMDQAFAGVLLPVWALDSGEGAVGLGLIAGAFGVGATIGSTALAAWGPKLPRRLTFFLAFLIAGAPRYVAMALGWPLAWLLAVAVVAGLAAGALNPILTAVEIERVPERLRSRVLAASMAIAFGGIPLGGLIGGWLVVTFGLTAALLVCGAAYLIATLAPLTKTWADMDRRIPLDSHAQVQSAR